jgi:hypothetical protein
MNSIEPPTNRNQLRIGNGELRTNNCAPSEIEGALWTGTESNRRHKDFQSFALPTELPVRIFPNLGSPKGEAKFGKIQDPALRDPKPIVGASGEGNLLKFSGSRKAGSETLSKKNKLLRL